jgi:CBS domain-containing protein
MKTVRDMLRAKGRDVWSVPPGATVYDALELMAAKNIGAVLVLDNERLVGIMSERDYARKVTLLGKTSKDTPVSEIMTSRVLYVNPDQTIQECMALMTEKRIRHLPVMENDRVIGVVTIGDVGRAIISDQQFMLAQLEHYITGGRSGSYSTSDKDS